MKAKTDSGTPDPNQPMPESITNLFLLMKLVSDEQTITQFQNDYKAGVIRYGDFKRQLGEDMVKFVAPIRQKAEAILNDEPYLKRVMEQGAEKARVSARTTMKLVREAMGLNY